jgi:putative cardiolipin synthase
VRTAPSRLPRAAASIGVDVFDAGWAALARGTAVVLALLLSACMALPDVRDRPESRALPPAVQGPLAQIAADSLPAEAPSGFRLLVSGSEALQARVGLIERAQLSVDLQVYQFRTDSTGLRVVRALLDAADRGVRVRLLLDDLYTAGDDPFWLGVAAHPRVEVRLFNPFLAGRESHSGRLLDAAIGDDRLHRRMHNKLLVADGVLAVAGGRNIGDPYFLRDEVEGYFDVDLLAVGAVLPSMSAAFDAYWNSDYTHDLHTIVDDGRPPAVRAAALQQELAAQPLPRLAAATALSQEFRRQRLDFVPAQALVAYDAPDKIERSGASDLAELALAGAQVRLLVAQALRAARNELIVVSPYLIPGPQGVAAVDEFTSRGVRVALLTNSLAATDERLVHVGYRHYRADLLRAGAELYEWSPLHGDRVLRELAVGGTVLRLHAKCALVDRLRLYVGSMNFDPRSRDLNTEFGLLIDSPVLGAQVGALIDEAMRRASWRVQLAADGHSLRWTLANGDGTAHDIEPDTDLGSRLLLDLLAPFVPEEML